MKSKESLENFLKVEPSSGRELFFFFINSHSRQNRCKGVANEVKGGKKLGN